MEVVYFLSLLEPMVFSVLGCPTQTEKLGVWGRNKDWVLPLQNITGFKVRGKIN